VTISLILSRFNPGIQPGAAATKHGAAIMWFMIFYGPFFIILYLMTGVLIDIREKYYALDHFKAYLRQRRFLIALFLLTMIVFVFLNFI